MNIQTKASIIYGFNRIFLYSYIALFLPIGLCVEFFNKQLEAVAYGSAIVEVITGAVYLIVSYYAVKKCVQALEERYDV